MSGRAASEAALAALEHRADRFFGKYSGTVTDNQDPLKRGRLQALVPAVLGEVASGWAAPCAPYAGPAAGLYAVPPVGATVWLEFEAGDPSRPIWVGASWPSGALPTREGGAPVEPTTKILRSDLGLLVALDDADQTISVSDSLGANIVSIKVAEGAIEVKSATNVVLEAPLIKHGQGASHPSVFGDQLLTYLNQLVSTFNAHVHPGETAGGFLPVTPAPPVAPMPPPTPSLISTKNAVE